MTNKQENIYGLGVHERTNVHRDTQIMRVPGGWIYTKWSGVYDGNQTFSSCFVPFAIERQPVKTMSEIINEIIAKVFRWKTSLA